MGSVSNLFLYLLLEYLKILVCSISKIMNLVYDFCKRIMVCINAAFNLIKCLDYSVCIHNITTYIFTSMLAH
nr:MAG TPA: hypothetical protein [Bacteriophage sp.]